jgi:hypothetical protein
VFGVTLSAVVLLALSFRVALISLAFIGSGLGLSYLTWWFWTTAQPESPALAALEMMSEREYEALPEEERDAYLAPWRDVRHVQSRKPLQKIETRPKTPRRQPVRQQPEKPLEHEAPKRPASIDPLLRK